jgi:dTDP-3-amino-2,3,6-trideoxy-4-keto-D-glucose/dTDP-3-amino-3,4,6-trideoxy-alpha-D-glucose/dTDP-2,6-dideoxy-D-kanosamine transaminase
MLMNNLSPKLNNHRQAIDAAVARVLSRSWFILGPEVTAFEKAFAEYIGVEFCLTVANGTDALEIGLRSVGIKSGDTVATTANSGFYTSTAILAIGASPIYLDVDVQSRVVTLSEVKRAIALGAKAIVATHLFGQAIPDIIEIADLCQLHSVSLIEDCAQSHGAKIEGQQVGSFGDVGCFSFYPTKNLGALGDGGAIVTNQSELAKQITAFRQYGWSAKYNVESLGRNSRLDEIQAAILGEFLPHLDSWNLRRREIALLYSEKINHPDIFHPLVGKDDYVAHLYVIRSSERDKLQAYLQLNNIGSDIHYPIPDTRQEIFKNCYADIFLPNTEKLSK